MLTGLSGSGKSSLAFDTIYAEGQRRYVESLSAYARQFLEMMQKPDVDQIDGLSPAISIEQKTTSRQPALDRRHRHRDLRLHAAPLRPRRRALFAGDRPADREPDRQSQMVDRVLALPEGTRLYLLAPIVRGRKGEYRKELAELQKKGFQRVKIDGTFYEIAEAPALDKKLKHDIEVVVDRIVVRGDIATRLADSFQTALELADGIAIAEFADERRRRRRPPRSKRRGAPKAATGKSKKRRASQGRRSDDDNRIIFSEKFACPVSGFTIPEIEPRLFSFNNPYGACPTCDGLGTERVIDPDLVVPDDTLTLREQRHRALGQDVVALLPADAGGARPRTTNSRPTRRGAKLPEEGAATSSSTAPARTTSPSPTTTASAPTARPSPSRASSPTSSAAGRRPTPPGCARRSSATIRPSPARPATATASSPRRWR